MVDFSPERVLEGPRGGCGGGLALSPGVVRGYVILPGLGAGGGSGCGRCVKTGPEDGLGCESGPTVDFWFWGVRIVNFRQLGGRGQAGGVWASPVGCLGRGADYVPSNDPRGQCSSGFVPKPRFRCFSVCFQCVSGRYEISEHRVAIRPGLVVFWVSFGCR